MFKFDFDVEDSDELNEICAGHDAEAVQEDTSVTHSDHDAENHSDIAKTTKTADSERGEEIMLSELMSRLPPHISYTPLSVGAGPSSVTLFRRDLHDARLQLMVSSSNDEDDKAIESLFGAHGAPSDLNPGIYEGGLKTWECSIDLAEYLGTVVRQRGAEWVHGKGIIEIGCGTALPTLYLLWCLFESKKDSRNSVTRVYLQDYNRKVLELMTLPNIIITWYYSTAAQQFRATKASNPRDAAESGSLQLTLPLIQAFQACLASLSIELHFFSGPWASFYPETFPGGQYDIVLTSETIYQSSALPDLVRLLRDCVSPACTLDQNQSLEVNLSTLSLHPRTLCLVAAKIVYFGVGGSVEEFRRAVEKADMAVTVVSERKEGLGRCILSLTRRENRS